MTSASPSFKFEPDSQEEMSLSDFRNNLVEESEEKTFRIFQLCARCVLFQLFNSDVELKALGLSQLLHRRTDRRFQSIL